MTKIELYQSVLRKLSSLPHTYLEEIDNYLSTLTSKLKPPEQNNKEAILSFAGSWQEMTEEDFDDYLEETRNSRNNLFNREINL